MYSIINGPVDIVEIKILNNYVNGLIDYGLLMSNDFIDYSYHSYYCFVGWLCKIYCRTYIKVQPHGPLLHCFFMHQHNGHGQLALVKIIFVFRCHVF